MSRVDAALRALRDQGERVTPGRRAVLEILDATEAHLDAEAIGAAVAEHAPGVHRATVYRSLQSLSELGVITHTHVPGSATIYHLASGDARHHAHTHLQCTQCQRFFDLPADDLEPMRESVRKRTGFDIDTCHAALLGTCSDCREG
ncbi:hypothetical protein VV02_24910 [Luteipulveratus mongoliensis]|uniref:Fur family transcriptional regulator n=2 Tax=Luteipulveratus mongoliensis TaxID=571913 RepID=A0A0K1JNN9_9MICO|nr:hypothetical protein VV02_24910 [Luteipulveratus mongoliensis]